MELSRRAVDRLASEVVIWLATGGDPPQSVPVWFLHQGDSVLVFSVPGRKVDQVRAHPAVHLNFNSTPIGGDVVRLRGRAEIMDDYPRAAEAPDYLAKYGEHIARIGSTPERFARRYSVAIRITLERQLAG
jgi:PPOX class probable F420-dependent enzyme